MKVIRVLLQKHVDKTHNAMLMLLDNHMVGLGKLKWEMFPPFKFYQLDLIGKGKPWKKWQLG
jgi:hypothetical protein